MVMSASSRPRNSNPRVSSTQPFPTGTSSPGVWVAKRDREYERCAMPHTRSWASRPDTHARSGKPMKKGRASQSKFLSFLSARARFTVMPASQLLGVRPTWAHGGEAVALVARTGIPRGSSLSQRWGGTAPLHGARVAELGEHRDITPIHTVFMSGDGILKGSLPKVPWPS